MAKKYKPNLRKKVLEERSFEEKQDVLKEKYDIAKEKEVVVVEKSNTFKFTMRVLAAVIKVCATIILLSLAFVGVVALVYPEPRAELLEIYALVREQLQAYLGL